MAPSFQLVFLALLLLPASLAEDENVKTLNDESFQGVIQTTDYAFVKFYAPWCGHCQKLAPDFSKAADLLKAAGSKTMIAKVDASVERACSSTYSVSSYPTLIMFKHGDQLSTYEGMRTAEAFVDFVLSVTGETLSS